jgi:hypothetical protein
LLVAPDERDDNSITLLVAHFARLIMMYHEILEDLRGDHARECRRYIFDQQFECVLEMETRKVSVFAASEWQLTGAF